jgi:hypothetical protein
MLWVVVAGERAEDDDIGLADGALLGAEPLSQRERIEWVRPLHRDLL